LGRWNRLWPSWPSDEWIESVGGKHIVIQPAELEVKRLHKLEFDVRSWACQLLAANSDEDDLEVGMSLEGHITYVDSVVETLMVSNKAARRTRSGNALQLGVDIIMKSLLFARRLRDRAQIADTVQQAVASLPAPLRKLAMQTMDEQWLVLPSSSALQRFQLSCGVGLMLFRRYMLDGFNGNKYFFADSSPQGGSDWLIIKLQHISADNLLAKLQAVKRLVSFACTAGLPADDDEPELLVPTEERAELASAIQANIVVQTLPPVALGLGHTALQDKAAACMYALFPRVGVV